jgi:hypothetical protein
MITPRDEEIDKALLRVYIFLLKLARDRQNVTTASVINSDEHLEPLQQNTHPKYNAPHDTVAHGPRGSRVKRLSSRVRKTTCPRRKSKRQKI